MNRRRALHALATAPAVVAAQDAGSLITTGTEAIGSPKTVFFTAAELGKLRDLAAKIFPSLDGKPGANDAGVAEYLDYRLSRSPLSDQKLYRQGLATVSSLDELNKAFTYAEPRDLPARFLRRLKEDVLQATFNSQQWIASSGRRGGGMNYYWKRLE
jgi:hypothetical protein